MSSFRRSKSTTVGLQGLRVQGTKPWINGQTLVSTGHKELDGLLGGGHALGTSLVLELDDFSNYGETLFLYSIAESLSAGFTTVIVTSDAAEAKRLVSNLPYNLSMQDEFAASSTTSSSDPPTNASQNTSSMPDGDEQDDFAVDAVDAATDITGSGLQIAWQYSKYIERAQKAQEEHKKRHDAAGGTRYCCSFDLGRPIQPGLLAYARPLVVTADTASDAEGVTTPPQTLEATLQRLSAGVRIVLQSHAAAAAQPPYTPEKRAPVRLFLPALARLPLLFDLESEENQRLVYHFMWQLKILIAHTHDKNGVQDGNADVGGPLPPSLTVSLSPSLTPAKLCERVLSLADSALSVEGFIGRDAPPPHEFRLFVGLLSVRKIQSRGTWSPFRPAFSKYGLKRDRRKLTIEALHLPPEDSRAFVSDAAIAKATSMGMNMKPLGVALPSSSPSVGAGKPQLQPSPQRHQQETSVLPRSPQGEHDMAAGVSISDPRARTAVKRFTLRRGADGKPLSTMPHTTAAGSGGAGPGALCGSAPSSASQYDF